MRLMLLLALLLGLVFPAQAADNAQIVAFSTPTERVKLRAQPDDSARVLGQYYGGQPVEILEDGRKWHLISIGGRTGYMMKKYLTDLTEAASAPEAVIRYPEADGTLPLYDQPGSSGREIARMQGGVLQVLGTVSQEWLHLRYTAPDGAVTNGYASALCITWPEERGRMQVSPGSNRLLPLRSEPRKSAESLGEFYAGTVVEVLIEDSPTRGWAHVRLGDRIGYMQTAYLQTPDEGTPLPTGRLRGESCPFYRSAEDPAPSGTLYAAAEFTVTAEQSGRCQLLLGSVAGGDAEWVWVDSQDIQYGYMTVTEVTPSAAPDATPPTVSPQGDTVGGTDI